LLADRYPTTYREYAAFTNFTIGVTDQLDIQLGARESEIRQSYADAQAGPLAAPPTPTTRTSANAFTFLVTPEYKLSPDAMLYVRLASGYRAGGPNFHSEQFGLPSTFAPDKTKNYDIGLKGRAFGQLLTYDASLYYIDWSDIQIREIDGGFASVANAGSAKSEGVELSITLNPLRGLTVSAWSAYNNAVLTSDLPPRATAVAESGDRLPYSSRWSGNLSMEQTFPINPQMSGFFGASANFVGDRLNDFTPTGERVVLPSYNKVDLHAGVDFDNWRVNLFANNVTNERGIVAKAYASPAYHLIKPRTLGVTISARF
jgi:outer membrane receptor protein involved in Fe transport